MVKFTKNGIAKKISPYFDKSGIMRWCSPTIGLPLEAPNAFQSNMAFQGGKIKQDGYSYNGIFSSVTFIVSNVLSVALKIINNEGNGDKILTVFTVPRFAVQEFTNEQPR